MGQERKGREWAVYARDYGSDAEFRAAIEQELVDIYAMTYRSGRGVIVAPLRARDDDGYFTAGYAFQEVFMPAVRPAEPEPVAEPEPDLEPVEA